MTYWLFAAEADAQAAEAACTAVLPPDKLVDGAPAPAQVTLRWDDVMATIDGRFGFMACPYMTRPETAVDVSDEGFAALTPAAQSN